MNTMAEAKISTAITAMIIVLVFFLFFIILTS